MTAQRAESFALPETLCLCSVQDLFNPTAHPRSGFGLVVQIGFKAAKHVIVSDVSLLRTNPRNAVASSRRGTPCSIAAMVTVSDFDSVSGRPADPGLPATR